MNPILIPCVTGKNLKFDIQLTSPTKNKPFVRGNKMTIVDCFTYGLILNRHIDPLKHYKWYTDFVKEHQEEDDLVFVAPDYNKLLKDDYIGEYWLTSIDKARCLVVPYTFLFTQYHRFDRYNKIVGYALSKFQDGPIHPIWTHSFSKFYKPLKTQPRIWTYDSTDYTCKEL